MQPYQQFGHLNCHSGSAGWRTCPTPGHWHQNKLFENVDNARFYHAPSRNSVRLWNAFSVRGLAGAIGSRGAFAPRALVWNRFAVGLKLTRFGIENAEGVRQNSPGSRSAPGEKASQNP